MKVLFLDIDGVLNTADTWHKTKHLRGKPCSNFERWSRMIDPELVVNLNKVIEATDAKVVVSSTWRLSFEAPELQKLLESQGFVGEVIDRTPDASEVNNIWQKHFQKYPPSDNYENWQRGFEIQAWLFEHPEVKTFAIVDDDSDMAHLIKRHVKTHGATWEKYDGPCGLHTGIADDLIKLLKTGR